MSWTVFIIVNLMLLVSMKITGKIIKKHAQENIDNNKTYKIAQFHSYSDKEKNALKIGLVQLAFAVFYLLFNVIAVIVSLFSGKLLLTLAAIAMIAWRTKITINK